MFESNFSSATAPASAIAFKMVSLEVEPESPDVDSDEDICDCDELTRLFPGSVPVTEEVVSRNSYILHVNATKNFTPNVAVALSDNTCEVYSLDNERLSKINSVCGHSDAVVSCKFSQDNDNFLYTASNDGSVKLWDIRDKSNKPAVNFVDSTNEKGPKQISCFDVSNNGRLLTAGTNLHKGDAYILFWDTRNQNLLGGYWESHTDDITQVKFNSNDMNKLLSGSTDGLINVYDLNEQSEDDALVESLNTESSIEKLNWFRMKGFDAISCITHTAELQLWKVDGVEPYKCLRRGDVAREIKRKSENYTYIVDTHSTGEKLLILAGSNAQDGECLRGFEITNSSIEPAIGFKENNQRVRCSDFSENTNILFTGGEKGVLNVWKIIQRI